MNEYNTIDLLISIQANFNKRICDIIFKDMSDHIFKKWVSSDYNLLSFLTRLDSENKYKLIHYFK